MQSDLCPNFVKAQVERAKLHAKKPDDEFEIDEEELIEASQQPEWTELKANNKLNISNDFEYDDGGPDVKVIPGGTLLSCYYALKSSFHGILRSRLPELPFSLTIAAGICDFTTKMKNDQASELAYPQSKLDSVIADIDFISAMAIAELKNPVRFSTIPLLTCFDTVNTSSGVTDMGSHL